MKLIIIFGPIAVGKMSVGLELSKMTGIPLFHNHATIEMLLPIFEWESNQFRTLNSEFRMRIFEEASNSDLSGLIFTYVWAFNEEGDKLFIDNLTKIFSDVNAEVYYIELEADFDVRRIRNKSELRLKMKPSKRDTEETDERLLLNESRYKLNTNGDFYYPENYLKINNTELSPELVAEMIIEKFNF